MEYIYIYNLHLQKRFRNVQKNQQVKMADFKEQGILVHNMLENWLANDHMETEFFAWELLPELERLQKATEEIVGNCDTQEYEEIWDPLMIEGAKHAEEIEKEQEVLRSTKPENQWELYKLCNKDKIEALEKRLTTNKEGVIGVPGELARASSLL